jgi:hypothetical protein
VIQERSSLLVFFECRRIVTTDDASRTSARLLQPIIDAIILLWDRRPIEVDSVEFAKNTIISNYIRNLDCNKNLLLHLPQGRNIQQAAAGAVESVIPAASDEEAP